MPARISRLTSRKPKKTNKKPTTVKTVKPVASSPLTPPTVPVVRPNTFVTPQTLPAFLTLDQWLQHAQQHSLHLTA
jgi:hypothetical protein